MGCEYAFVCCAEYMKIRKSCQGMVDTCQESQYIDKVQMVG